MNSRQLQQAASGVSGMHPSITQQLPDGPIEGETEMNDMKVQLSNEQRALVDTVRSLARSKFRGRTLKYMDGTFPWENMRELAEDRRPRHGDPGGIRRLGLPVFDTALVIEEVAKVCYATAMALMGEVGVQTARSSRPTRRST